jgi:capsular polysaccharide transport system permease protein
MNMHGFIAPTTTGNGRRSVLASALTWVQAHRPFIFWVVLPTLLVGCYVFLVASDQYQSEARFTIQTSSGPSAAPSGMGDLLGISAQLGPSQSQAFGVADYLESQEAVDALQREVDLVAMFRRQGIDPLARLHPSKPKPEKLFDYYKSMVHIRYDRDSGISELEVRAFRPDDAYRLAQALLALGERRVNYLNERMFADAVANARTEVARAEQNAQSIEKSITAFRQTNQDVNPTNSGQAQTSLVAQLTATLSASRAQLAQMGTVIGHGSPQYRAMATRVSTLEAEVNRQSGRLTGGDGTIAARLGGYEDLLVRQQFAGKRYESAAAALEKAVDQARRQDLYLVKIVDPNRPVRADYPQRGRIMITFVMVLLTIYGIGWLIVAGVREHAA